MHDGVFKPVTPLDCRDFHMGMMPKGVHYYVTNLSHIRIMTNANMIQKYVHIITIKAL